MRILLNFMFIFIVHTSIGQSVVYKKNPATGNIEVFQGQGGLPVGLPIYKIKKNVFGYLEIENVDVSTNPYTNKPDYSAYNNFKPYQLPVKEIFQTIETLNQRFEYDYIVTQPANNNTQYQKELKRIQEWFKNRLTVATAFLNFYNSNSSFPNKLKDGWYEVVEIYESQEVAQINVSAGYSYEHGICKIENNRISEYYKNCSIFDLKQGYVFQKIKIDVSSAVSKCKATFRPSGSDRYTTIYFMDNLLDPDKQIINPNFSYYSIYTSSNVNPSTNGLLIQIARNKKITREEALNFAGGPYQTYFQNANPPQLTDCKNSMLTLAFRKTKEITDKFSISVFRLTDKKTWLVSELSFSPGNCTGTTLTE